MILAGQLGKLRIRNIFWKRPDKNVVIFDIF